MFDEILSGLSSLTGQFQESVRDQFGQSFVNDVLEPLMQETNALIAMQENSCSELVNFESLRSEIASMKSRYE